MVLHLWISDSHFDLLSAKDYFKFVSNLHGDSLILTGDISTGRTLIDHLTILATNYTKPIYFILGNHDLWRKFRHVIQDDIKKLQEEFSHLHYLTNEDITSLTSEVALVGDDGWYDSGYQKPYVPFVFYWDWYYILDFRALFSISERYQLMTQWATAAAKRIKSKLISAFAKHKLVYLATHMPVWPEKVDNLSSFFWKPYNSSKIIAQAIEEVMEQYPDKNLIVLAGHTHDYRREKITNNIELRVAEVRCGAPSISEEIWI